MANIVLVWKANNKWCMYVDFTDLNTTYPKDPYLLPNMARLIDGPSDYYMLIFMDAYSGYNHIWMDPLDGHGNYY